mmetsp:Transcript_60/g.109  ORF Transcript_60/g.109 Transcript_60/m.109 type:complete len:100 (+) Transcript_60:124-423(+)
MATLYSFFHIIFRVYTVNLRPCHGNTSCNFPMDISINHIDPTNILSDEEKISIRISTTRLLSEILELHIPYIAAKHPMTKMDVIQNEPKYTTESVRLCN